MINDQYNHRNHLDNILHFFYCQSKIIFFYLFNPFGKHWITLLRWFCLLNGALKMLSVLFPQESLIRCLGHSFHSSVPWIEIDFSAHYQKLVYFCEQYFRWIDTWRVYIDSPRVDMWITMRPSSFCSNSSTVPSQKMWYLQLGKKHISTSW